MSAAGPAAILDVDLGAIAANWLHLDASHPGETAAVVKADAYGLGVAEIAPRLHEAGAATFFTAQLEEALVVRQLLPGAAVLVLNGLFPNDAIDVSTHRIIPVLGSLRDIAGWRAEAARRGQHLATILHLDTGMNRLGLATADLAVLRENPDLLAGLRVEMVMTHLIAADVPGDPANAAQVSRFAAAAANFPGARRSLANSSGMFLGEKFQSDLARPGAALYGINPTPGQPNPLRPVIRLSAPILQIRDILPGETVGYNGVWTARRASRIAVLGLGYADGLFRQMSNQSSASFDGAMLPLVGRVSMDLTTFDVTDSNAQQGDFLNLIGPGHDVDAIAIEAGTNGYEILTSLGRRYQRRYHG